MKLGSQQRKKRKKLKNSKESLCKLWDIIRWNNIHILQVTEEEREKGTENLFNEIWLNISQIWEEIWTSKYMKFLDPIQIQPKENFTETHGTNTVKNQRPKRILKSSKGNKQKPKWTHKALSISLNRNLAGQESLMIYSKCWKKKILPIKSTLPAMLSFRNEGVILS